MKYILFFILVICTTTANAHNFTWDNLVLAHAKNQSIFDYEQHVDSYMQIYRKSVWERYKEDEFELEDKRQETIQMMKNKISSFNLNEEFIINTSIEFQKYNFKGQYYPLEGPQKGTYYAETKNYTRGTFLREYRVYFSNYNIVTGVSIPKKEAKEFLQSRKNSRGTVDRDLPATIKFMIKNLGNKDGELIAEITEVNVYTDDSRNSLFIKFKPEA